MLMEQNREFEVVHGKKTIRVRVEFASEDCKKNERELTDRLKEIYLGKIHHE